MPDDHWTIATADDGGNRLFFRIRAVPPAEADRARFPRQLAVTWEYDDAGNNGLPASEVLERMSLFEDRLTVALEDAGAAFATVVVTGNGAREWHWYIADTEQVMGLVNQALSDLEPFPVIFSIHEDPEWEGYFSFLSNMKSDGDEHVN